MKTKTFADRLGSPGSFPLELTLPGGERRVALHPDYAYVHPETGRLCLFSDRSDRDIELDPAELVRVRRLKRVERHRAGRVRERNTGVPPVPPATHGRDA